MDDGIVQYRSLRRYVGLELLALVLAGIGGYFLSPFFAPQSELNLIGVVFWFFLVPLGMSSLGFGIGWKAKKDAVDYTGRQWEFEVKQCTIEECRAIFREYRKRFPRLLSDSQFWHFYIPVVLMLATLAVPLYAFFYMTWLGPYVNEATAALFVANFGVSSYGGFRATSNEASDDFGIPLIRESLKLARTQEKTPGISHVRILLDRAQADGLSVYRTPRVLLRIDTMEKIAYIESLTEELGAVSSIFCRLFSTEDTPEINWWWTSRDRHFRKYIQADDEEYYVKLPVPTTKERLGVKDVPELTANAVALVIIEALNRGIAPEGTRDTLTLLNVPEDYPLV
ncbi:hypothetical protein EU538_08240 [Candidatus Thorarchaeota archaeon]|nr:MAG: hypothetical protein EU538_08240 [Candidatus Thorarchaeota archaeon]